MRLAESSPPSKIIAMAAIDPFGAAGISLDLKVIEWLGGHGQMIATGITKQNHKQWLGVEITTAETLSATWQLLGLPQVIKTGMVFDKYQWQCLLEATKQATRDSVTIVCDPVLGASSGGLIWNHDQRRYFLDHVLPRVDLLTPNIPEAQFLTECSSDNSQELATRLRQRGAARVLVKGGHHHHHLNRGLDYYADSIVEFVLSPQLAPSGQSEYRGTGCFLASAIATLIGQGYSIPDACLFAKSLLSLVMAESYTLNQDEQENHQKILKLPHHNRTQMTLASWIQSNHPHLAIIRRCHQGPPTLSQGFAREHVIGVYPIVSNLDQLRVMINAGAQCIQFRSKETDPTTLNESVSQAIAIAKQGQVRLYINDHWQLAIEHQAYGVHLGQEDLDIADIQAIHNAGARLGISSHCYYEALIAKNLLPSYIALGPVFETTCKSMAFNTCGIAALASWVKMLGGIPVVAIGGLGPQHLAEIKGTGVTGVATISDILHDPSPDLRFRKWQKAWTNGEMKQGPTTLFPPGE